MADRDIMTATTDAAWLRASRARLGLSQAELAAALGLSQPSISQMEAGRQPVTRRTRLLVEALVARELRLAADGQRPDR